MSLHCQYEKCGGKQPRLAEHGPLCHKHYSQLGRNLSDTPELIRTALEHTGTTLAAPNQGERISGSKDSRPTPVSLSAITEADELYVLVAVTAESIASQINQPPPRIVSTRGISVTMTPESAEESARQVVRWLVRHLREATKTDDIITLAEDAHTTTQRMRYLWPIVEKDRHLPGVPCRECDLIDVWYTPPSDEGWPITIRCHSCDYVAPEEDLIRLARLVEYEQNSKPRRTA